MVRMTFPPSHTPQPFPEPAENIAVLFYKLNRQLKTTEESRSFKTPGCLSHVLLCSLAGRVNCQDFY